MRNKYKEDYEAVERINPQGKVVTEYDYIGDFYKLSIDGNQKKRYCLKVLILLILVLILHLVAGSLNASSSRTFWIVLPYICMFLPMIYAYAGLATFAVAGTQLKRVEYMTGLVRLKHSIYGVLGLATINAVLDFVFLLLRKNQIDIFKEIIYLICFIFIIIVCIAIGRIYDKLAYNITVEKLQY